MFRRQRQQSDFNSEVESHIALEAESLKEQGFSEEEAQAAARRAFGNVTQAEERFYQASRWRWWNEFRQDVRYSVRQLGRNPGFAVVVVVTFALGIGTTAALFTIAHSVLLQPLPFRNPARLLRLYEQSSDGKFLYNNVAAGVFAEWGKQNRSFSDLAILSPGHKYSFSSSGGELPEIVRGSEVSSSLFRTLGLQPALGRSFTESDDQASADGTVVLSWGFWKHRFAGDPAILGRTIDLNARPYTVIGVMPSWVAYPDPSVQVWTPINHEETPQEMRAIDSHDFTAIGRLRPGVTRGEATVELSVIVRRLHDEHLDDPFVSVAANSRSLLDDIVGDVKTPLYVLLAATGCFLLIACLNVAGLMVARGAARRRELAIRTALGGSQSRLLRQHLTESLLLSVIGGSAGLLIAFAVTQWLVETRPDIPRVESIHVDFWSTAVVLLLVFAAALFASLVSSLSVHGGRIFSSLQESSRSQTAAYGSLNLRKALLTLEVSLTVVLLVGAGLLLKSYQRLRSSNLGCITNNVLTMRLTLPETKYSQGVQRVIFFKTLLERVRALPGVEAAGLARAVPGQGYPGDSSFRIAEHPPLPLGEAQYAIVGWADPGYFAALGIPLLRGRLFGENQELEKAHEAIISNSFARNCFPGEDPIGKHLSTLGQRSFDIVGVVGDTRYRAWEPTRPIMYFPAYGVIYGGVPPNVTLAVRAAHDASSLALPIQRIVQKLDPDLAISDILTMNQLIGRTTLDASFDATLMLAFALLSLMLAAVGLFGIASYVVTQRTQEIGIRMALGAEKNDVLGLVIAQGMMPALVGLAIGVIGALALTRFLVSLLYSVRPSDPITFAAVALLLVSVALLASYFPARRATKVDPMVALRYE